jgi:integrase
VVNPDQVRWALMEVCVAMRIERVGPHMFRHAGATMAAQARMPPEIIKERLGHSKVSFTLDMYVHPNEDDHKAAGALMAELLGS